MFLGVGDSWIKGSGMIKRYLALVHWVHLAEVLQIYLDTSLSCTGYTWIFVLVTPAELVQMFWAHLGNAPVCRHVNGLTWWSVLSAVWVHAPPASPGSGWWGPGGRSISAPAPTASSTADEPAVDTRPVLWTWTRQTEREISLSAHVY